MDDIDFIFSTLTIGRFIRYPVDKNSPDQNLFSPVKNFTASE